MTDFSSSSTHTSHDETIFSVSLVSKVLKDVVESQFSSIRVRGEVTGLKRHTSGHIYFALKDDNAVMDAVCWRGTKRVDLLREGLEIIAFGKITTYPGRSKYQMIVSAFEPTGEGALLQLLMQLKEKLLKEGLFDARHKKPLPPFPKRIGLITSPTGAVLRDIMHRLRERYPCHVLLKPVLVQGDGASQQVTQAIIDMNALPDDLRPDVLIVARGGGGLEDLFAFNDETLVRTAFSSSIPLISAIGHETDVTLLDFVADVRAPTPTAAAELATPVLSQISLRVNELALRLSQMVQTFLEHKKLQILRFDRILQDPLRYVFDKQQRVDDWAERFHLGIQRNLVQKRLLLGKMDVKAPKPLLDMSSMKVAHMSEGLRKNYEMRLSLLNERLQFYAQGLENLSYRKTLERGFCLAYIKEKESKKVSEKGKTQLIASVEAIKLNLPFTLQFADGEAEVKALPTMKQQGQLF